METSRLNNTIEYIGESLKYKEVQIDHLNESIERLITQVADNIQQLQSVNNFMAQLSSANVLQKVKELNAFDDLHHRLSEVTVLRADTDANSERLDTIDARTLKEAKNFKFDMGVFTDKHEHLIELVDKNADIVHQNKKELDL